MSLKVAKIRPSKLIDRFGVASLEKVSVGHGVECVMSIDGSVLSNS